MTAENPVSRIVWYTVYVVSELDPTVGIIQRCGKCRFYDMANQASSGQLVMEGQSDDSKHQVHIPADGSEPSIVDKPPVEPVLADVKAAAKQAAGERKWEAEISGVPLAGMTLSTDDRSKLLLNSAAERAKADPEFTTKWKMDDGTWIDVDAATLLAAYDAVFDHVQACFAREQELDALIDAATDVAAVNALAPVIAAFWAP